MENKEILSKKINKELLILCFIEVIFLIMNFMMTYVTDDWHFRFVFNGFDVGESEKKVSSITDIYTSMTNYYKLSGGRVLAHTILTIVMIFPKVIFDILNSGILILFSITFTVIIFRNMQIEANNRIKERFSILVMLSCFLFFPVFGETCLWVSGSINYLWMSLIVLLLLASDCNNRKINVCFLSLIAGFTNEITAGMLMVFFLLKELFINRKIPTFFWVKICLLLPGMLFVVLAPGNINRAELIDKTEVFSINGVISGLVNTGCWLLENGYMLIIVVILVIVFLMRHEWSQIKYSVIYLITSLAGMIALTLSGVLISRSEFICIVFLLLSLFSALVAFKSALTDGKIKYTKYFMVLKRKWIRILAILLVICYIGFNLFLFFKTTIKDIQYTKQVEDATGKGENIKTRRINYFNYGKYYPDEMLRSQEYSKAWQSLYYGIKIELID